jgi:CRP/FNR family cyclic AMP-dependent transcriptional regulator
MNRFSGRDGKKKLLGVLSESFIFHGIPGLAELVRKSRLQDVPLGKELITQGEADDAIHIIVCGEFDVEVNGRFWAKRSAGNHIGESTLIDPTAKRNATARACEASIVLTCKEKTFSTFADANPDVWRRIAVELSRRLTERTKLTPVPRSQPVLFLGCSSEALGLAQEIQLALKHDVITKIWTDGIFHASKTPIEDLTAAVREIDFGLVLLTPDDKTISRHRNSMTPRDNVLLELGLLMGALGRERTFFVVQHGMQLKIPSDLLGVTPLEYVHDSNPLNLQSRIGPMCTDIRRAIKTLRAI